MTTPTQAQIEAAAKAMEQCMFAPHELPLDDELHAKYLDTATAALTAAAEVGVPDQERAYNAEQNLLGAHYEIERLKAELEIQRDSQISAVNQMLAAEQRESATIERCAQVAEWFSNVEKFTAEQVAARIRAQKDIKERNSLSQPQSQ